MKKKIPLLIVILILVVLLGGAYVLYDKLSQGMETDQLAAQNGAQTQEDGGDGNGDGGAEKTLVPDFTVYDRNKNEVRLSDFVGKPVVLNFWASWCGPCQSEMPDFNEVYAELGEEIHFLMVNMTTSSRESFENATLLLDERGYSFPVYYDLDGDAAATYGVYSLPTTYFIDAEGYGVARAIGAIDRATLEKGIGMITEQ